MIASPRRGMANNLIIIFILIIHSAAVAMARMAAEKSNHQHSAGRTAEKRPTTRKRGRPHYGSIMLTTRLRCATPILTVKNALEIARPRWMPGKTNVFQCMRAICALPPICNDDVVSACHAVSGALLLMMMSVRVTMCEFWNAFK